MADERKHWAQSNEEPETGSPPGVRPISLDALNHLGVDGEGNLYWIDTKILTAKKEFKLSFFQGALATITAISAMAAAVAAGVSAYVDWRGLAQHAEQQTPASAHPKDKTK